VRDETIVITHPCHPFRGRPLTVLHYRRKSVPPRVLLEFPDESVQCIPLAWTDQGDPERSCTDLPSEGRLSGSAALELVDLLEKWKEEA
jgi:hypothetical protein